MLGTAPRPEITPQQPAPQPIRLLGERPAKVCAIPLLRVPVKNHIDDRVFVFLRHGYPSVDSVIFKSPAVPACR